MHRLRLKSRSPSKLLTIDENGVGNSAKIVRLSSRNAVRHDSVSIIVITRLHFPMMTARVTMVTGMWRKMR